MPIFRRKPRWASQNVNRARKALEAVTDEEELRDVALCEDALHHIRVQAVERIGSLDLLREIAAIQPDEYPFLQDEWTRWDVGATAASRAHNIEAEQESARLRELHDYEGLVDVAESHPNYDVRKAATDILISEFPEELEADIDTMRRFATNSGWSIAGWCEKRLTDEDDLILVASSATDGYARDCAIRRLPLDVVRRLVDEGKLPVDKAAEAISVDDLETLLREGYEVPTESLRRLSVRRAADLAREGVLSGDDLERMAMFQRAELELLAQNDGIKFSNKQYSCPHAWESRTATSAFTDQDGWWYSEGDTYYECRSCGLIIPC